MKPATKAAIRALTEALPIGWEHAVPASELAQDLGLSERQIGQMVADLIDNGLLVGSTCDAEHHGYFLIQTEEDLDIGTRHMRSRAVSILRRVSKLRTAAKSAQFNEEALRLFDLQEVAR